MNLSGLEIFTPLSAAQWIALSGVPASILALYFLKLRRRPVQVSSTLLWKRSLEDLHVNSLFQRLRRNLLLFLQLLMVGLLCLALLGLRSEGFSGGGRRIILVVDHSASMSAVDAPGGPTRLERAKAEAKAIVESMRGEDLAMVIAFADKAQVISNYTGNIRELTRRIEQINPTEATTALADALQVASGLANPSKMGFEFKEGEVATEVEPPDMLILTDGGFADVPDFSLGTIKPQLIVIGPSDAGAEEAAKAQAANIAMGLDPDALPSNNLAILALQTRKSDDEKSDQYQVFGRVRNFRDEEATTTARLLERSFVEPPSANKQVDAVELTIPARGEASFQLDRPISAAGALLTVELVAEDALPVDNRAYTLIGNARKAQVLIVTPGNNRYLTETLSTPASKALADVVVAKPEESASEPLSREIASGRFDLVIYDGARPKDPPEANALYFGTLPPGAAYDNPKVLESPTILDWDVAHPLMQYIRDLRIVAVVKALGVEPPQGAKVLIESDQGPLAFIVPRGGFSDAVVTFGLVEGGNFNTTWPLKISFPLFLYNALQTLGNAKEMSAADFQRPGEPITLRAAPLIDELEVIPPDSKPRKLARNPQGAFVYNEAEALGLYQVSWKGGESAFAVNLFDPRESDLATRGIPPKGASETEAEAYKIKIGNTPVEVAAKAVPSHFGWWKPFAALALAVVLAEWYIYNRRVYL